MNGTIKDVVDEMREEGASLGVIKIGSFRPFPLAELRRALVDAKRVIVVEKDGSERVVNKREFDSEIIAQWGCLDNK